LVACVFFHSHLVFGHDYERSLAVHHVKKIPQSVIIFHVIDNANWGEVDGTGIAGKFDGCFTSSSFTSSSVTHHHVHQTHNNNHHNQNPVCEMITSATNLSSNSELLPNMARKFRQRLHLQYNDMETLTTIHNDVITVGLYHIHTWVTISKGPQHKPDKLLLPTFYTMAESEESSVRFKALFDRTFKWFDGYSTTHPTSTVPRFYFRGWNQSEFISSKPFHQLVQGAAFVASTCHRGDWQSKRQNVVKELRNFIRVDGLGRCLHTPSIPEGFVLPPKLPGQGTTEAEHLQMKRQVISNYMFYFAFENSNEPGYVTEKVFDGLLAGTVPVYLGASTDCKKLIPHPKAVIFVDDFDFDMDRLGKYLLYLISNETAYEEHRIWREDFQNQLSNNKGFIAMGENQKSWPCRICQWALNKYMQE
jgi:hypothetical protein